MGKTYMVKTPPGDFKVTTLENPLLSKQAVTNKGISVPYTNLQLNPYSNTQLDLFCNNNLSFKCTAPSTWLTNSMRGSQYASYSPTWERHWLQSSSIHHMMKIKKLLGHKTLRCTNTAISLTERWTKGNFVYSHNLREHQLCYRLAKPLTALKIILIYV